MTFLIFLFALYRDNYYYYYYYPPRTTIVVAAECDDIINNNNNIKTISTKYNTVYTGDDDNKNNIMEVLHARYVPMAGRVKRFVFDLARRETAVVV